VVLDQASVLELIDQLRAELLERQDPALPSGGRGDSLNALLTAMAEREIEVPRVGSDARGQRSPRRERKWPQ